MILLSFFFNLILLFYLFASNLLNLFVCQVVIGFMTLIGSFLNMCTVRLIGKRKLLITCTFISVTCQCIIGLHAMGTIKLISISSVLPFILLCIVSFVSGYGITPIPWIMLGEIFPMK